MMRKGMLASLILLPGLLALASHPPHWSNTDQTLDCESCHTGHHALGGTLTTAGDNVNLCQSCHNAVGLASALPIDNADKSQPGFGGVHHGFDVPAVNGTYGAGIPANVEMTNRIYVGNIVCSTCHDQHSAWSSNNGTPRISAAQKTADGGGSGTCTSGGAYTGPQGYWYLVEIDSQGNLGSATFLWRKHDGTDWTDMGAGVNCGGGAPVLLDNGVTVTFAGGGGNPLQVGDRWEFYASYPFLRAPLDEGNNAAVEKFCRDCHGDWVMDHTAVETYDGTYKSHPVGVGLGTIPAQHTYDRAAPLDGDGTGDDGIASNNLKRDAFGYVQCLTCHGVHYADSLTETEDGP